MNTAQELRAVRRIRWKQRKRLPMTDREWIVLAYSPFGTAAYCRCKVHVQVQSDGARKVR